VPSQGGTLFSIMAKKTINKPTNAKLYAKVKAQAKRKFDKYPSVYANAWLVREYKKQGGGYRKTTSRPKRKK